MRYTVRCAVVCAVFLTALLSSVGVHARSHTYFVPRSVSHHSVYEHALRMHDTYYNPLGAADGRSFIQVFASPFYMHSRAGNDLGAFFTPCNKNPFIAAGDSSGNVDSRAFSIRNPVSVAVVNAVSEDLPTGIFRSKVRLSPERTAYGAHISIRLDLSHCIEHAWFHLDFAPMSVKHKLNFCESEVINAGDVTNSDPVLRSKFRNMSEALRNPDWCKGQFQTCSKRKGGVDDIQLKFGYDWDICPFNHWSFYALATIPTGERQESEYVFEPVVGTKHAAFGAGMEADWRLHECGEHTVTAMIDFKYRYLLCAQQYRSFDLKGRGDWSRYLNISPHGVTPFEPGINKFTVLADVKPRSQFDAWAAVHYQWLTCWHLEAGYDFWWRVREKVTDPCRFREDGGFHRFVGENSNRVEPYLVDSKYTIVGSTTRGRVSGVNQVTIALQPPNTTAPDPVPSEATLIPYAVEDLDLKSAEHPRVFSHTMYGAIAYNGMICGRYSTWGLALSFEVPQDRKRGLEMHTVWGTFGIRF